MTFTSKSKNHLKRLAYCKELNEMKYRGGIGSTSKKEFKLQETTRHEFGGKLSLCGNHITWGVKTWHKSLINWK